LIGCYQVELLFVAYFSPLVSFCNIHRYPAG
jgi:hypothetical protein